MRATRLSGRPVCVHSSLASFGRLAGGANALVQAFLDEGCTLLVPTFSWDFAIDPPHHLQPPQNGWDYGRPHRRKSGAEVFDVESREIDADMGALATAVVNHPARHRGNNALASFSVVGPLATEMVEDQTADEAVAPLEALVQRGGRLALIGVDLRSMTLLHLAERLAGRTLFRRWALNRGRQAVMVEVGGCSHGFGKFEPILAAIRQDVMVGPSHWQVFPADKALALATTAIRDDRRITMCDNPSCVRCRDAILGGPTLERF